jgi:ferritin-like metal-binding protein YciE
MFERIDDTAGLFEFRLGSAYKMEHTVLEMLGKLEEKAQSDDLKRLLRHHAEETRQQIANLEQAFHSLGREPDENPCPAIDGIEKEGNASIKKTTDALVDVVILAGATETEYHEIAVYECLIIQAEALGHEDLVPLFEEILEQERYMLDEVRRTTQKVAQRVV